MWHILEVFNCEWLGWRRWWTSSPDLLLGQGGGWRAADRLASARRFTPGHLLHCAGETTATERHSRAAGTMPPAAALGGGPPLEACNAAWQSMRTKDLKHTGVVRNSVHVRDESPLLPRTPTHVACTINIAHVDIKPLSLKHCAHIACVQMCRDRTRRKRILRQMLC